MKTGLSSATVKNAKASTSEYLLADGRQGLYLRVLPTGSKSWLYKYKFNDKSKKLSLGLYPDIGLAEARDKHAAARLKVRQGIDPAVLETTPSSTLNDQMTVSKLLELYTKSIKLNLSEKTQTEVLRTLNKYVIPIIGDVDLYKIKRRDAISLIEKYANTPGQARAIMKISRAMFTFALHRELVDFNPFSQLVSAIPKIKAKSKNRALLDEEIHKFCTEIYRENSPLSISTRRALLLILVTGQRPEEVTEMMQNEISVGVANKQRCQQCRRCGWWTIPWRRIKTRKLREEDHKIYLSPLAMEIIKLSQDNKIIFPGPKGNSIARHALSHYVADHKSFGLAKWTPHDLRRTTATGLSRIGCSDEIIDAILNHSKQGVIGIYNQNKYENEKIEWLLKWSYHLNDIINSLGTFEKQIK